MRRARSASRVSELLLPSGLHGVRHDGEREGRMALVRVVAGGSAERPAREHVGLPVRLHFHTRYGVICGKELEHPGEWMIVRIFQHVRRDDGARLGDFAARETAPTLAPFARIIGVSRTNPAENPFAGLGADT